MPNIVNVSLVNSIKGEFSGVSSILLFNFQGMKVKRESALRTQLGLVKAKMLVVKNSVAAIAFKGTPLEGAGQFMSGPVAIIYGGEDIVTTAKATQKYLDDQEGETNPGAFVGAILEGQSLDAKGAAQVHKMQSKKDAQAHIVGLALGPGSRIAGILKAIIEKHEGAA
mgnify:CR=1 FL=1